MHLQKVATQISLRSPGSLNLAEIFAVGLFFARQMISLRKGSEIRLTNRIWRVSWSCDDLLVSMHHGDNLLANDKISGLPKLKALADDKSNITQNIKIVFHRLPAFSSFPTMFSKGFSSSASKIVFVW